VSTLLKMWLTLIAGWGFLFLGVIGLFLPVLQGILFIVIGLVILSAEYAWAHHVLQRAKEKFPGIAHHAEHAKEFIEKQMNRMRIHRQKPTITSTQATNSPIDQGELK
jgi:uncharacterized membrane protein YbaN (DUF454 family)